MGGHPIIGLSGFLLLAVPSHLKFWSPKSRYSSFESQTGARRTANFNLLLIYNSRNATASLWFHFLTFLSSEVARGYFGLLFLFLDSIID